MQCREIGSAFCMDLLPLSSPTLRRDMEWVVKNLGESPVSLVFMGDRETCLVKQ